MEYSELGLNRFGKKAEQSSETSGAVESSANPQDNVFSKFSENGVDNGKSDARNILTGTVITSCFIKTSDLAARVELSGNDARFYDDSKGGNGAITGDTATLNFVRADKNSGEFIMGKRHGKDYDLDNVMEMYYTANTSSRFNYLYIGRQGNDLNYETNYIELTSDHDSTKANVPANGQTTINLSKDGVPYANSRIALLHTNALGVPAGEGARVILEGEGTYGGVQLAYYVAGVPQSYIVLDKDGMQFFPALPTGGGGYGGEVSAAGASIHLPTGWTCTAYGGVDGYGVTHNLGDANYGVTCTISESNTNDATVYVFYKGANGFNYNVREGGAFTTSYAVTFTLVPC